MRYAQIQNTIWFDEVFSDLSPLAQRCHFYILASPHANMVGLYQLKLGYACEDLKCTKEELEVWIKEIVDAGLIKWDAKNNLVLIINHLEENPITSPNTQDHSIKKLKALPKSYLLDELEKIIENIPDYKLATEKGKTKEYTKGLFRVLRGGLGSPSVTETDTDTASDTGKDTDSASTKEHKERVDQEQDSPEIIFNEKTEEYEW